MANDQLSELIQYLRSLEGKNISIPSPLNDQELSLLADKKSKASGPKINFWKKKSRG